MPVESLYERIIGFVMARSNADMEQAAIDRLAPLPDHHVLEIGFGPGVGIEMLAERLSGGRVAGADPSAAMVATAHRRNRFAVQAARVELVCAFAHELPWPDASFDGVLAVNCAQLFDPPERNYREVGRVMRPGARLVTLTHDWAITRHRESVEQWLLEVRSACESSGLAAMQDWTGTARTGGTVGFSAIKPSA